MATDPQPPAVPFDRRKIYRPFLERLNPIGPVRDLVADDLIVRRDHDQCDSGQPPIHVALANAAELSRGMQIALVGGIGSGKTTELRLTQEKLSRHSDAVNILLDLADLTDLSELNPGAILAAAGIVLYSRLTERQQIPQVESAYAQLHALAFGETREYRPDAPPDLPAPVDVPGLLKFRFLALRREVKQVRELLLSIASPLLENDAQITLLIDGLDRLIRAERFREFAEQDLYALRGTKITVIVVAPLLLLYDKSRFLDTFDDFKHIRAAANPLDSDFLRQILERRGALELMHRRDIESAAEYSGGVLRDLVTLAHSAAQYAYGDDKDLMYLFTA